MSDDETPEVDDEELPPEDPLEKFLAVAKQKDEAPDVVVDEEREHVFEQLASKRWDDLGVLEYDGRILFPEKIWKRNPKTGKFVGTPCLIAVPRGPDLRKARVEAYALAEREKLDPKRDRDQIKDLEDLCIIWCSIRDPNVVEGEFPPPLEVDAIALEKRFDRPSLDQVYFRIDKLRRALDPRVSYLTAGELSALTAAMVARQDLAPLAACDGATQHSLLLTLAAVHQALVRVSSSAGSPAPSRAEP
jgi:hypothetical protein